ncbi:MAG: hypothetical protein AABY22_32970 [Nanoarchaeota archaeon]
MTDSPTLRDFFEDDFDFDYYESYLFGDEDLGDTLTDIHDRIGDSRKNVEAITHESDFLAAYERQIEDNLLREIISMRDLDKLEKIAKGEPTFRLVARDRGTNVSKEIFDTTGKRAEFEKATEWLRENNPRQLGYLKGIKTYREKAQAFRLVFG